MKQNNVQVRLNVEKIPCIVTHENLVLCHAQGHVLARVFDYGLDVEVFMAWEIGLQSLHWMCRTGSDITADALMREYETTLDELLIVMEDIGMHIPATNPPKLQIPQREPHVHGQIATG